jgi:Gpi18-like mannosyltransferase
MSFRFSLFIKVLFIAFLFSLGMVFRFWGLGAISGDMRYYLIPWYNEIAAQGFKSFSTSFSNYTPPYLYFLALATLTKSFIPQVVAIKLISIFFDVINVVLITKIARVKYLDGLVPIFAAASFWVLPTIFINSAFWGQADAIYTCFLLLTFYFHLKGRPLATMIVYGISVSFKAQAIFLAPFLFLFVLKKRIPWYCFGVIPVVYMVLMVPALLAGRPIMNLLTIYFSQATNYQSLAMRSPNPYIFFPNTSYSSVVLPGFFLAVILTGLWVYRYGIRRIEHEPDNLAFFALISVIMMPFFLPKMHDRYFYPADVFSLVLAIFTRSMWFIPLLYQLISGLAYLGFLFDLPDMVVKIAASINTLTFGYLLWQQYRLSQLDKRKGSYLQRME